MNKVLYVFLTIGFFSSCANSYYIKGTSSDSNLEDSKIYLTIMHNDEPKNIDSCEVVHGQFSFSGTIDSVRVAQIGALPVVLEKGDITVKDDNTMQAATGTPLNDKLSDFMGKFQQLMNQSAELQRRPYQAMMNGEDLNAVEVEMQKESARLDEQTDKLLTSFVTENFDNVLGPWVFINACAMKFRGTPMLDAWVEDIMSKATPAFKNDPMVREYYHKAQQNEKIMNGLDQSPATSAAAGTGLDVPTPNELAAPKDTVK